MALEDVVKGYEKYSAISGINERMQRDSTNPDNLDAFLKYLQKYDGIEGAHLVEVARDLKEKQTEKRERTRNEYGRVNSDLVEKVEANYDAILNTLPERALLEIARDMPDKNKKYVAVAEALKHGDVAGAKKAYAETYKDSAFWQEWIANFDADDVKRYIDPYVKIEEAKFINKKLCTKSKDEKGKDKYTIDAGLVREYVTNTLKSYGENEGLKSEVYETMAGLLYESRKKKK